MSTVQTAVRRLSSNRCAITRGLLVSGGVFVLFGIVTGLIPNPLYVRMVPRTPLDYLFLALTALLAGVYTAQRVATDDATTDATSNRWAIGASVGSFLAVGCPICNVFLLALFSSSALMTYFDPLRPALGAISVGLLAGLVYSRHNRNCRRCELD
ncbi:hypothetical protein [Haladaptatus sp. NG-WS-4]